MRTTALLFLFASFSATATAQDAESAKVAVVVVGDPEAALTETAASLESMVNRTPDLSLPTDPALRRALLGGPEADDGLEAVRRLRRGLGLSEQSDLPSLERIARITNADLLLLVRSRNGGPEIIAFDAVRSSFFAGVLSPSAGENSSRDFVRSRARAAREARGGPAPEAESAAIPEATSPGAEAEVLSSGAESSEDPTWLEEHWPYLVGGALLLGTLVWFLLPSSPDDPLPPVLQFRSSGTR